MRLQPRSSTLDEELARENVTPDEVNRRFTILVGLAYFFICVAVVTTAIRIFTRWRMRVAFRLDDYLIILSVPVAMAQMGIFHVYCADVRRHLLLKPEDAVFKKGETAPEAVDVVEHEYFMLFILSAAYLIHIGVIKLSILQFYHRFMTQKAHRVILHSCFAITLCLTVSLTFAIIFVCKPVDTFWRVTPAPTARCVNENVTFIISSISNLVTDLVILVLPIRVVLRLQISPRKKWGLVVIFGLGGVASAATLGRAIYVSRAFTSYGVHYDELFRNLVFTTLETGLATFCANAPALAALTRAIHKESSLSGSRGLRNHAESYGLKHVSEHGGAIPMREELDGLDDSSMEHIIPATKGSGG